MGEVLLMAAPNGARRGKADHPALPVTAAETARAAADAGMAGAAALHLHVRDDQGGHSLDADLYRKALSAVAETAADLAVQITTEAVGAYTPRQQMALVEELKPAAVSLALRELVADEAHEDAARDFFAKLKAWRVSPQFILYEPAEVGRLIALRESGVIAQRAPFLLFVLGRYTQGQQSTPEDIAPFIDALGGRDLPWMMCAFGRSELECARFAVAHGGHVRIGFENNLHLPDGEMAPDNAALVEAAANAIRETGLKPMTAAGARALFAAAAL